MASMSFGFNFDSENKIKDTPNAIGSIVNRVFLNLRFKKLDQNYCFLIKRFAGKVT